MSTLRFLVGSAQLQLKQLGDDRQIPLNQLYLWATYFVNKFIYLKAGMMDTGSYLTIFPEVEVKISSTTAVNLIAGYKYSDLPREILDFDGDRGIKYINYQRGINPEGKSFTTSGFMRISPEKAQRLYYSKYEKPSSSNPYFYRYGKYIGYIGIEDVAVNYLEAGLLTPFDPFVYHSIDDDIPVLDEFANEIQRLLLEMGRFDLLIPDDRINDGSAGKTSEFVPKSRLISLGQSPVPETQEEE